MGKWITNQSILINGSGSKIGRQAVNVSYTVENVGNHVYRWDVRRGKVFIKNEDKYKF